MRELALVLVPAVAIVWIVLRLFDLELRQLQPAWERRLVGALALVGSLWLVGVLAAWFAGRTSEGTWFCPLCGALEERLMYFGVTVDRWEPRRDRESQQAGRYSRWVAGAVSLAHAHDWIPTGCQTSFSHWACSPTVDASLFHVTLPSVPDDEIARSLVLRLAAATPEERRSMLRDFNSSETGPFAELAHGPLSLDVFDSKYQAWLGEHPLWR